MEGRTAATRLTELGAVVVTVSTATGSAYDPDGLNVAALGERAAVLGDHCLDDQSRFSTNPADLLSVPVDVLVPAARGGHHRRDGRRSDDRPTDERSGLPTNLPGIRLAARPGRLISAARRQDPTRSTAPGEEGGRR